MWLVSFIVYLLSQEMATETGQSDYYRKKKLLHFACWTSIFQKLLNIHTFLGQKEWGSTEFRPECIGHVISHLQVPYSAWAKPCTSRRCPVLVKYFFSWRSTILHCHDHLVMETLKNFWIQGNLSGYFGLQNFPELGFSLELAHNLSTVCPESRKDLYKV